MQSLQGKKAIISGASSGIGEATAYELLKAGCDVLLMARRKERLEQLQNKWAAEFPKQKIVSLPVDLRELSDVDSALASQQNFLEGSHILVNNAGLAKGADSFQNAKWEDFDNMLDTNLKAFLYLTKKILPYFLKNNNGHIVNLGSVAGRWTYPGGSVYCATKFAVRAISEGLRQDLLGKNIRVTNIEPGMVETEFSEVRFEDAEKAKSVYKNMTPLSPQDISESILWCLRQPAHVNIQELVIYPTAQASPTQVHRA